MKRERKHFLDLQDEDLDHTFWGYTRVTQIDAFKTQKSGSTDTCERLRSIRDKKTVRFVCRINKSLQPFPCNGDVGLIACVTENINTKEEKSVRTFYFPYVSPEEMKDVVPVSSAVLSFNGKVFFDDLYFNPCEHIVTYYCEMKGSRNLIGFEFEIPIIEFNRYVSNRDMRYVTYNGAKRIEESDDSDQSNESE